MQRVVDMHCDTLSALETDAERNARGAKAPNAGGENGGEGTLRSSLGQLDLLRMKESGYLLQNFAIYVDAREHPDRWGRAMRLAERFRAEMKQNEDLIRQVRCYRDIEKNEAQGILSALLTVEEGGICEGRVARLRELYEMGVRMMTLTWNYPNELGDPAVLPDDFQPEDICFRETALSTAPGFPADESRTEPACARGVTAKTKESVRYGVTAESARARGVTAKTKESVRYGVTAQPIRARGLTERGREFVSEMEKLGIIPDVSHLSDEGFWEVVRITERPFVASHSNARALCGHGRNLTDGMIRCIGERGGVIGLNFYEKFLAPSGKAAGQGELLDLLAAHAGRIIRTGGEEALGLGSDFDGIPENPCFPGAQCMGILWDGLRARGFSERQLDKIFSENVLRVYRDVLR